MTFFATAPTLWLSEETVPASGHSQHPQTPSPVSEGFVAPILVSQIISFRPDALAASMARTLTLRTAPDVLLAQRARSQLTQVEFLVTDGASFELSPFITALADDLRPEHRLVVQSLKDTVWDRNTLMP